MVHYDICQNSHHSEPLSCMGARASQPTHFLKFRLTGFRLNGVDCTTEDTFCQTGSHILATPMIEFFKMALMAELTQKTRVLNTVSARVS